MRMPSCRCNPIYRRCDQFVILKLGEDPSQWRWTASWAAQCIFELCLCASLVARFIKQHLAAQCDERRQPHGRAEMATAMDACEGAMDFVFFIVFACRCAV